MRKALIILLILPCTYFCSAQNNQSQQLYFNYLSVKNGLPEGSVFALLQDKQGYIWIGTQNGLVSYDGYTAKKYELEAKDAGSITVFKIFEDREKRLWIGTNRGLYYYNRANDVFDKHNLFDHKYNVNNYTVDYIRDNNEGNIWIIFCDVEKKVFCAGLLNIKTKQFSVFSSKEKGSRYFNAANFYSWLLDKQNLLWIWSDNGLLEYMPTAKRFKTHYLPGDTAHRKTAYAINQDSLHPEYLWFLIMDKKTLAWEGVSRYNINNNTIKAFRPTKVKKAKEVSLLLSYHHKITSSN